MQRTACLPTLLLLCLQRIPFRFCVSFRTPEGRSASPQPPSDEEAETGPNCDSRFPVLRPSPILILLSSSASRNASGDPATLWRAFSGYVSVQADSTMQACEYSFRAPFPPTPRARTQPNRPQIQPSVLWSGPGPGHATSPSVRARPRGGYTGYERGFCGCESNFRDGLIGELCRHQGRALRDLQG